MVTKPKWNRYAVLRKLGAEYDKLCILHSKCAPRNGIPVAGGDWMDSFFRMEGLRGTMTALRDDKNLEEAFADGKAVSEIAIRIWNSRREGQVHRWEECVHNYLDTWYRRVISTKS